MPRPTDQAACVWDVNDPTRTTSPQLVLRGHKGFVSALAKLADGRLASGGQDKIIRIWNVAGGILEAATPVAKLEGHTDIIRCLAALDGDNLASGSNDRSIIIWNLADGAQLAKLEGHTDWVRCLTALDGDNLASGSDDKSIIIWNLADNTQLAKLEGHTDWVYALAALADGQLASGSDDKSIIIWNLADNTQLAKLEGHTSEVWSLAALDGDRFASGSGGDSIIIWNVADGAQLAKLKGHSNGVNCLAALDGDRLASGGNDATIIIWNVAADSGSELLAVLPGHTGPVRCLAVVDGGRLASGGVYVDAKAPTLSAINDSCKEGIDRFGSRPLAGAIVEVVGGASPPVCVGLYAKWGRGKSFLIHQIKQHFDPTARINARGGGQLVQHFEPGYDNLSRAFTEKAPPKKAVEPSRSTCGKVLDFISNALFYILTLTLWWFYKRETVITIIDTVAETIHDLGAIGKDLWNRAGTILGCCRHITYEKVPTGDDIESSGGTTARETFRVRGWALFIVLALTLVTWLAALITFCVLYPVRSAPYSYVLIAFFVASLPVLSFCFLILAIVAREIFPRCRKRTRKFCCLDLEGAREYLSGNSFDLVWARTNACSGVLWALVCLYVSLLPSLRSKVIGLAVTAALLAALFILMASMGYVQYDYEMERERETQPKPAVKREYVFVDFNAWEYAQSDELWTGLIKKMYAAVELRLSKEETFTRKKEPSPDEARVATSLARDDWKTAWRVKRAKELLTTADEWSTWGLRLRALLLVLVPPIAATFSLLVLLSGILEFAGVSGGFKLFSMITNSFTSVKNFFDLVAVTFAPIVAAIATYKAGIKTDEVAGKSRGEAFFEEASKQDAIKDRLGFLARVKDEVTELFSFLHTLKEETGLELIIVPFVDDLDRVMGGNGDRVTKVLEAVSLILSIDNAPVVTFLAIDPRIVISSIEDGFGAVIQDAKVTGWEYLDKIVQIPIAIPPVVPVKIERFITRTVVDSVDATPEAVAARLRNFAKTARVLMTNDSKPSLPPLHSWPPAKRDVSSSIPILSVSHSEPTGQTFHQYFQMAVFPSEDGYRLSLTKLIDMISDGGRSLSEKRFLSDLELVRHVASRLDPTKDKEKLIASISEEGIEDTCRALNDMFRTVKIVTSGEDDPVKIVESSPKSEQPSDVEPDGGVKNTDLNNKFERFLTPSFAASALAVSTAEQMTLRAFAKQASGNPRRLKRVANVFQLAVAYAKRLAVTEADQTKVYDDPRWPLFALKLIKFIVLCEEHPIRMSLLVSQVEDSHQKAEVNDVCTSDMFQYLADDHQTAAKHLEPSMLLATFYYKHVDSLYYLQRDCSRHLMQDGDPETFAMLLSMKLPEGAIKGLPSTATTSDGELISDMTGTAFDIVVGDLICQDNSLTLLDYALNLSPALRDSITRDVAQNVSTFEPRLPRKPLEPQPRSLFRRPTSEPDPDPYDASLREGSVRPKAAYLLQPPKAPQE